MIECKFCGKEFEMLNSRYVEGIGDIDFCEECEEIFYDMYVLCIHCDCYFRPVDITDESEENLCIDCFEYYYTVCDTCCITCRKYDTSFWEGNKYCNDCLDDLMDEYSVEDLTEMLLEKERSKPFPLYFLEKWLLTLTDNYRNNWTCPCQVFLDRSFCPELEKNCGECERNTLFVEIKVKLEFEEEKEPAIKKMFVDCLEELIKEHEE